MEEYNSFNQTQVDNQEYTSSSPDKFDSSLTVASFTVPLMAVALLLLSYFGYRAFSRRRDSVMNFDSLSSACQDINDAFELSDMDSLQGHGHESKSEQITTKKKYKKRVK